MYGGYNYLVNMRKRFSNGSW